MSTEEQQQQQQQQSDGAQPLTLRLGHFNDVYHSGSRDRDPCGGGARFVGLLNSLRRGGALHNGHDPLVLFAGDAFFPSIASQTTLGKHMVPVLNACGIGCATIGNHEMDGGLDILEKRIGECNFPWLLANVKCKATNGGPFVTSRDSIIIEHEGVKVGVVGVAEEAWVETLAALDPEDVIYEDFVACVRRIAPQLRAEGADMVVALTHMRVPNDQRLAEEAGDVIDIILGGHDHHYEVTAFGEHNIWMVKSGTDFRDLTVIDCVRPAGAGARWQFTFEHKQVVLAMEPDAAVAAGLVEYEGKIREMMKKVIGQTAVPLDCRFSVIRSRESNISNFVADCCRWNIVVRPNVHPDVVILNAGTLRTDAIVPAGEYKIGDLCRMLPYLDPLIVLEVPAEKLIAALENGVSQVPALEGRFPCVSGVRFQYDSSKAPGERVIRSSVVVGKQPIDMTKSYTLATKEYLAQGKDGFDMLPGLRVVLDSENLTTISQAVQRFLICQGVAAKFNAAAAHHTAVKETVQHAAKKWRANTKAHRAAAAARAGGGAAATSGSGGGGGDVGEHEPHTWSSSPDDDDEHHDASSPNTQRELAAAEAQVARVMSHQPPASPTSPASPRWAVKVLRMKPRVEGRIVDVAAETAAAGGGAVATAETAVQ